MGRWSYSGRLVADSLHTIDIYWLRRKGLLCGYSSQEITWSCRGEKTGSIGIFVKISDEENFARLNYTITRRSSGKKDDFDYKIPIISTPCYFGGKRYWFLCPAAGCGRRVAKLYEGGDIFACRHCYNLTYQSRNENPTYRGFPFRAMTLETKISELWEHVKKETYKGKPTKKVRRIQRLESQMGNVPDDIDKYLYK